MTREFPMSGKFSLVFSIDIITGCDIQIHRIYIVSGEDELYERPPIFTKAEDTVTIKAHLITCAWIECYVNGEIPDSGKSIKKNDK